MKALFAFTGKYDLYNGKYYSNGLPASTWNERYLNIFDEMTILGRYVEVSDVKGKALSSTERVRFHCTDIGVNPIDYIIRRKELNRYIEEEVKKTDFVICRLALFGAIAAGYAQKYNKPYICEVVGSAWDDNWNYSPVGKIVAPYFEYLVKRTVKNSRYTIYVTQQYLQREYPTKGKTIGISNVEIKNIDENVLAKRINRIQNTDVKELTLCTLAAVDVKYKGQVFVLQAMKRLRSKGIHIKYVIIGGGKQDYLIKKAKELDVYDDVCLTGAVDHKEIFKYLDDVDIYIQPSLQEGLPRAMIEALSRGLPAIGFRTAGIPELISEKYVCRKKSVEDICNCISNLSKNDLLVAAQENFEMSKSFLFSTLNKKREKIIREAMKEW